MTVLIHRYFTSFRIQIFLVLMEGFRRATSEKKDLKYDSLWQTKGHLRIYFWVFFVLFGIFLLLYFIFSHNSYYVIIRQMQHTVLSELITCFLLYKKF